jgi:hypothetical protein
MVNGKVVGQYISTGDTELDLPIAQAMLQELGYEQRELPLWMHIRQQAIYFQDTCSLAVADGVSSPTSPEAVHAHSVRSEYRLLRRALFEGAGT